MTWTHVAIALAPVVAYILAGALRDWLRGRAAYWQHDDSEAWEATP